MDIAQSHFELFGLAAQFAIDRNALEQAYREVLARVHPDRFAAGGAGEQRVALQWATQANEAYRTLRDDVLRARYLCELRGIALAVETNTAMPGAFLVEQMELREALEEARDSRDHLGLGRLKAELAGSRASAVSEVAALLDQNGTPEAIALAVRKLMFLDRFRLDVEDAVELLEDN